MKAILLISTGILNILHAAFHVIQFIQSILLVTYVMESDYVHEDTSLIDKILHSPYFAILWAVVGVITLVIGIKDYRHHRKCKSK